jgi:hypothetical protein
MRGASVGVGGLANVGRRGGSFGVSAGRVRAPCVWLRVGVPRDAWIPKVFFIEFFFFKKKSVGGRAEITRTPGDGLTGGQQSCA